MTVNSNIMNPTTIAKRFAVFVPGTTALGVVCSTHAHEGLIPLLNVTSREAVASAMRVVDRVLEPISGNSPGRVVAIIEGGATVLRAHRDLAKAYFGNEGVQIRFSRGSYHQITGYTLDFRRADGIRFEFH